MLKILFGILLLINGALFAFHQGYLDTLFPPGHEPARLAQQLHADKLTLIPPVGTQSASATAATAGISMSAQTAVSAPAAVIACTEVGNFDATEAKRFETQLAPLALGTRLTRGPVQDPARYMVYIPPLAGKDAADKKSGELRRLGVEDFFVIQDHSPLQWGISLGIFKTEEAAHNQLTALNQKGVRSARIGVHAASDNKIAFQLHALDAATRKSLDKIKDSFPHQELRACTAPAAG